MRRLLLVILIAAAFCAASPAHGQFPFHKKKQKNPAKSDANAAPDKILYDRAMNDVKRGRHEIGRLSLQTLINTYPDSEYLAKAKLAIADSYYKEGGSANTTQAIAGYKDFIVFFPFLPEAAYAQYQVANAHYRQMDKPDRDRTQALAAEDEFQTFLQKYPKDPLAGQAEQKLRNVQEELAEGEYRVGYFYYVKGDRRAAAGRLLSLVRRYPLYSRSDRALWMLGDIYERSEHKEISSVYYTRIVRDYPLSPLVPDAKKKLVSFGVPVPQPDPRALAWMEAESRAERGHAGMTHKATGIFSGAPDMRTAARNGIPNMSPQDSEEPGTDVLTGGQQVRLGAGGPGTNAVVEVVTPGTAAAPGSSSATPGTSSPSGPSGTSTGAAGDAPASNSGAESGSNEQSPAGGSDNSSALPQHAGASSSADVENASKTVTAAPADGSSKNESSSKKKKGLRKIMPW